MRKRNQLYKKAKQSGDFSKYKLGNRVVSNFRREKGSGKESILQ